MCEALVAQERVVEKCRKYTETTYVFKDGSEFGIKQYLDVFSEDELQSFEKHVDGMLADDEPWLANTIDISPPGATGNKKSRTKYFFPKYTYSGVPKVLSTKIIRTVFVKL